MPSPTSHAKHTTLLFGGSGFFGPIILERYPAIVSVGRSPLPQGLNNEHITIKDMDDLPIIDDIDFDTVIFLIGNSDHHRINQSCIMGFDYNVLPLKKILHYLRGRRVKKFIAFTGALMYDATRITLPVDETQPLNPYINDYVFSKYIAEEVTKLYRAEIPIINVRLSNIYGPTPLIRPDLVPTLIQQTLSPGTPEIWSSKPARDFIYAKDAADAVVKLLDTDYTGPVNLGSGVMRSVGHVTRIIEKLSGKKIRVLDKPVTGPMQFVYDISLVSRLTGWHPRYSLEEGLAETYTAMAAYADQCRWWEYPHSH